MAASAEVPCLRFDDDVVVGVGRMADMRLVGDAWVAHMLSEPGWRANKRSANHDRQERETPHGTASFPRLPQIHRSGAPTCA